MLQFDKQGHLTPRQCISTDFSEIQKNLLFNIQRQVLWANYRDHHDKLTHIVGKGFYQWLSGDFFSLEDEPKRIEVVNFIPFEFFITQSYIFKDLSGETWSKHGIYVYFVPVFPAQHAQYSHFEQDTVYWRKQLGTAPRNLTTGRRVATAFLEIAF